MNFELNELFEKQLEVWDLARNNYEFLSQVQVKNINFGDFEIKVQYNPRRIQSSGVKVDPKSISERKCFLCQENLSKEQIRLVFGDFNILVNPFPIFPKHFTIAHKSHIPQAIAVNITTLLQLACQADEFVFFYNGPRCGASAPDHLHFQAAAKSFLPLVDDINEMKNRLIPVIKDKTKIYTISQKYYLRTVVYFESKDIDSLQLHAKQYIKSISDDPKSEPMMNIVVCFTKNIWQLFIIPRKQFRPWQFDAIDENRLLISPATVEMCGIFITPIKEHFEKISKDDIISIFNQISWI
jgi:ATP adenylyltransferase/5',5'''-P-1,P-4-tetraphosphate phosphorylase II